MKVIFLDFDGPIIPLLCYQQKSGIFTPRNGKAWPSCIEQLNRVTDTTGAKIVVSSTWRLGGFDDVKAKLAAWGATGEVVGITPVFRTIRGAEIGAWLLENPEVTSFVIFDDDKDMGNHLPRLIHTPFETGITKDHADRAIAMLA